VVGDGRVLRSDLDLETLHSDSVRFLRHEGSHSTAVFLRSDGRNVSQWGNVGRYGRPDNVFNLSWAETFERAGQLNQQLNLPAFTVGEQFERPVKTLRDARLGLFYAWTGARVSELHLTANYSTGSDSLAREAIRHFTSQRAARLSKSRLGATTVVFGNHAKGGRQVEVYTKADEMLAHAKGEKAKEAMRQSMTYQWARDVGLVRVELKMRRMALRDAAMNYAGGITMEKIVSIFAKHTDFLIDAAPERTVRLVDSMPRKLRLYALSWIRGDDVAAMLSRAQFYRVRNELHNYGIDISEPRAKSDTAERDLQSLLDRLPEFQLRPLQEPEWYDASSEWGGESMRIAA
jgi:hypothetical protein